MNIEEIEESKKCLNEIIQNTYAEGKAIKLDNLRKYIKELEQKESILDKVTEFIKDDVTAEDIKFEGCKLFSTVYKSLISKTKEKIAEGINSYKDEIEDIIEGENK